MLTLITSAFLAYLQTANIVAAQDVSALLFQADGMAGSVVDATGCKITYVLECTDQSVCSTSSDLTKTVTQNGASSFAMSFVSSGAATASISGDFFANVYETCRLYSTTAAYCTAMAGIVIGSIQTTTTSTFVITQEAFLSYGQVAITAGPARAKASVSSCSRSGNKPLAVSASATVSETYRLGIPSQSASTSSILTSPVTGRGPSNGLSTGAKAGIGIGVGVGVLGVMAAGAILFCLRRRRAQSRSLSPATGVDYDIHKPGGPEMQGNMARHELYQPQSQHEMPCGKEAQEMSAYYDGYASSPLGPRHEMP